MPIETEFRSFRWVKRFVRIDAEQPVGTARMVLSFLRANQWALFELARVEANSSFYACQKKEIQPRLENAGTEVPVRRALGLERSSPSQAVVVRTAPEDLPLNATANAQEPWLTRLILTDRHGEPLAIGVPTLPRERSEKGYSSRESTPVAERTPRDMALYVMTDASVTPEKSASQAPQEYSVVRIFYGTDRAKAGDGYSNRREKSDSLHFGTCDVTLPRDRRLATFESPRWWKFWFSWNPKKHVMLQRIIELPKAAFLAQLQSAVLEAADHSALVFIHGYNVSFEDGARRTAQLSYDLGFDGAPILYSWPSANSLLSYLADEATIDWTKRHLSSFLTDVASTTGAETVHVIAHSMGNRALARILDGLSLPVGPLFKQVVLAAPDIDSGEFLQLAEAIQCKARRITLYASSNDKAIKWSKKFHKYPRAGESGPDIVVVPGLDTIDVSKVDTSFLGHSYFAEKRTVISDLFYLIRDGKSPDERHSLEPRTCPRGQYWAFKP
jgi:esterase/lipase superfamily enzyme